MAGGKAISTLRSSEGYWKFGVGSDMTLVKAAEMVGATCSMQKGRKVERQMADAN